MTASLTESVMDTAEASVAFSCLRYIGGGGCLEFDIVSGDGCDVVQVRFTVSWRSVALGDMFFSIPL